MDLIVKMQQNKWYWAARNRVSKTHFCVDRSIFSIKRKTRDLAKSTAIATELVKTIIPLLLTALAFIIFLLLIEKYIPNIHSKEFTIINFLPDLIQQGNQKIQENSQSLATILSVLASISAIFLGLYFTAISVLAGSVYSKVPHDIRNLLLKEKVGSIYIKILITLTSISILLLGYRSLGYIPGILNVIFLIFVGCLGIISFGMLGLRTFYFFDPTRLSDLIFEELFQNIKSATIKGFKWDDKSFQTHYRRIATKNLITLETLVEICKREKYLKAGPLTKIMKKLIDFLIEYGKQRAFIPNESNWYTSTPQYADWFLTDHPSIEIAIRTQTSIQPKMILNHYWMEERVLEILYSGMKELAVSDLDGFLNTIDNLKILLELYGLNLELDLGRIFIDKIGLLIDEYFQDWEYEGTIKNNLELAIYDTWASLAISPFLSFSKYIRESDPKDIIKKINNYNFSNPKNAYLEFVPKLLGRVEYVNRGLQFERHAEGKTISPQWYITQLIVSRLLELIKDSFDETNKYLDDLYVKKCDILFKEKKFLLNTVLAHRGRELINKVFYNIDYIKHFCEKMETTRINKEIPWIECDWDVYTGRLKKDYDKLIEYLAKSLPYLLSVKREESFPDLFGQTYSYVLQDCYDSMLINNINKFKVLFPNIFFSAFVKFDELREKLKKWIQDPKNPNQESAILAFSEPLMDLMVLSGYAKIYSELYNSTNMWKSCESIWEKSFESIDDIKGYIELLLNLHKYRKSIFKIISRDIYRTNWKLALNNKLRELNLIEDRLSTVDRGKSIATQKHKSPLIRALCRGGYEPHEDPVEVFIITYLLDRPESEGIEFKDRWGLKDTIEQETKSKKKS